MQVLIYDAFNFEVPTFGHVSLILAPDKSKLSKRHGATSVGEFREQGFLPEAMVNYLSLLGWNDGTEQVKAIDSQVQYSVLTVFTMANHEAKYSPFLWENESRGVMELDDCI